MQSFSILIPTDLESSFSLQYFLFCGHSSVINVYGPFFIYRIYCFAALQYLLEWGPL